MRGGGGGVLQGIVGWGVPPGPPNPVPILDQKNNAVFLSLIFGIETTNAFIQSVVPFIPDSRPKWVKSTPVFRPKRRKNYTLLGGTYL